MKNLQKLMLIVIVFIFSNNYAQNGCPGNIFQNGDLETGVPTNSHQDIDNAAGFSRIWATGSLADYYNATTSPGGMTLPFPPSGNYASFWVCNAPGVSPDGEQDIIFREGLYNTLTTPISAGSGSYNISFDYACLGSGYNSNLIGNVEMAVYGISNVPGGLATTPTSLFNPLNPALFPSNMVLISTIPLNGTCSNNKVNYSIPFNANGLSIPNITHFLLTRSDNQIPYSQGGGRRYMAVDNFCLTQNPIGPSDYCCSNSDNQITNGNFEGGLPFVSDYTYNNTPFPGEYAIGNRALALAASPQWDVEDHSKCTIGSSNSNFLMVNGKTQQPSGSESVIWRQSFDSGIPADPENCEKFKFCANFKNLAQCAFDIKPQVAIRIISTCGAYQTPFITINAGTGQCDWQLETYLVNAAGWVDIEIVLKEDGNGDGNDLAIDDISFQLMPKSKHRISVSREPDTFTDVITASLNTLSPFDDILDCDGLEYFWTIAEYTTDPLLIVLSSRGFGNSSGVWGVVAPGNTWGLTTTFPGYNIDPSKNYTVSLTILENPDCCIGKGTALMGVTKGYDSFIIEDEEGILEGMIDEAYVEFKRDLENKGTEIVESKSLSLFPNPVKDVLNFKLTNAEIESVQVLDLLGNNIVSIKGNINSISVDKLSTGSYILSIISTEGILYSKKFIKE